MNSFLIRFSSDWITSIGPSEGHHEMISVCYLIFIDREGLNRPLSDSIPQEMYKETKKSMSREDGRNPDSIRDLKRIFFSASNRSSNRISAKEDKWQYALFIARKTRGWFSLSPKKKMHLNVKSLCLIQSGRHTYARVVGDTSVLLVLRSPWWRPYHPRRILVVDRSANERALVNTSWTVERFVERRLPFHRPLDNGPDVLESNGAPEFEYPPTVSVGHVVRSIRNNCQKRRIDRCCGKKSHAGLTVLVSPRVENNNGWNVVHSFHGRYRWYHYRWVSGDFACIPTRGRTVHPWHTARISQEGLVSYGNLSNPANL